MMSKMRRSQRKLKLKQPKEHAEVQDIDADTYNSDVGTWDDTLRTRNYILTGLKYYL